MSFGDYIVYVDESGDHSMVDVNPEFPRFILAFCIFPVTGYTEEIVPAVERLKFEFFGHDMVVLHEREIRKNTPPFDILLNASVRRSFMARLTALIRDHRFGIVACVIRKNEFRERVGTAVNPYNVALEYGLERAFLQLQMRNQARRKTYVVFESRGKKEDAALELEFRRIMGNTAMRGMPETLEFMCVSKQTNSSGLQVADLVARPIGIHDMRPSQNNQAWETINAKLVRSREGRLYGFGLKVYP